MTPERIVASLLFVMLLVLVGRVNLEHTHYAERKAEAQHNLTREKCGSNRRMRMEWLTQDRRDAGHIADQWEEIATWLLTALGLAGFAASFTGWFTWLLSAASAGVAGYTGHLFVKFSELDLIALVMGVL